MANTLRIKRRASGSPGAPSSLANAELAFNEVDNTLYYGKGTGGTGGSASTVEAIAGSGAYLTLSTEQTVSGAKTFTGSVALGSLATATTPSTADNSTTVATTAYVQAQSYLTAATGVTSVGLALPNIFSVSGSPVTTTGTLTGSLATQDANKVFAGPGTGSAAAPIFRVLVADDIPSLAASKISDFDTQVRTNRLDQLAVPTASVSLNSQKITALADPVDPQDAATKAYVDASRLGLDVKQSVKAATTGNITLSGEQTIDGVALVSGDRVLVKNQDNAAENSIYTVAGSAWARATDFNTSTKVTPGAFTFVEQGSANADSGWVLTTDGAITLGSTDLAFVQFSGAGQIDAGGGLTKSGNTLDVGTASSSRIVVNADNIDLATTGVAAGTYKSVTVDTYGRVTDGTNPTTLAGYGITDAQPLDATLTALAGVTTAGDKLIYATGADAFATTDLSSYGRSLIDDADAAAARTTLGLGSMATQNANNVAITGGTLSGITIDGGTFAFIMGISTLVLHQIMSMGAVGC
jgi:hypothetical protein